MKRIKSKPMYRFLMVLTIFSTVGLQGWRTLFNNFAVEVVGLEGNHIGIIQSVREVPGFLALLVVFVLLVMKEHRLSAVSVLILGVGVGATGLLPFYYGVILTTLVMSFGFHYYETTNQSLTLQYFSKETSPWVFGKLRSLAAAANIAVGVFIYFVEPYLNYTILFFIIGAMVILAALWGLFQNPTERDIVPQRKKMVFRKKYWLYYFLTFMAGERW